MSNNAPTPSPQKKEGAVVAKAQITAVTSQTYQGPIPPASEMQKYAAINPELPMRIMAMAEKQSAHRQEIEKIAVAESFKQKRLGATYAFILGVIAIAGGVYCIVKGYSAYGIALIIADLAALAGAFAYGTYKSSEERMRKWNEVKPPRE